MLVDAPVAMLLCRLITCAFRQVSGDYKVGGLAGLALGVAGAGMLAYSARRTRLERESAEGKQDEE